MGKLVNSVFNKAFLLYLKILKTKLKQKSIASRNGMKIHGYTVPSSFLSLSAALFLLALELVIALSGFMILEGYSFGEAFYMTIITISTVGYTEVRPLSDYGRMFASLLIILNIGVFAYFLAVFSYYIIQGEIFKQMHLNLIRNKMDKLSDHVILCGFGKYGKEVATHFSEHNISFIVIENNPKEIEYIQKSEDKILYLEADATQDEALIEAGIKRARAVLSALPDDSDNVFIVLTARQLNPTINIISRAKHPKSQKKLLMAGANHVVMPEQIGGFYMATLVSKPGAVEFFSFITNESKSDIGFEELHYKNLPEVCKGQSILDLAIRQKTGANIIGYIAPNGQYIINPSPEVALVPDSSFIILGDRIQLEKLKSYIKSFDRK